MSASTSLLGTLVMLLVGTLAQGQSATTDTSGSTTTASTTSTSTDTTSGATVTVGGTSGSITINSGTTNLLTTGVGGATLSGGTLTLGTVSTTATTVDTTTSGLILTGVGSAGSISGVLTGGQLTSTTIATSVGNSIYTGTTGVTAVFLNGGGLNLVGNPLTLGATFGSTSGVVISGVSSSTGVFNTIGIGSTTLNATTTLGLGSLYNGVSISLSNGGSLNLTGILNSGLNVVSSSTSTAGGITLGTSGLSIIAGSSEITLSVGTIRVNTLGSLPAGNSPNSASFAVPAVALLGVGDVGGQTISERGVVYSLNSVNTAPTPGGTGVIRMVHTGLPDATGGFSQTATGLAPNTAYTYRVYATDSTGATYLSSPTTFTTPTVLQNWRQTFFGTTQGTNTAADNADPDNDGLPNLIEFATGNDPTTAQNSAVAVPTVNGSTLEYTYTRSLDALNSGTTFTVQWNDTLDPSLWSSSGVSETVLSDNGLLQQVKATLPASSTGRRFVRLNVLPPAN